VTFAGVYWHEEERLPALLELADKWFTHAVIGVQADSDIDETLVIARNWVEDHPDRQLVVDTVKGFAEPTLHTVVGRAKTPWTFVISGDEWPDNKLLSNFDHFIALSNIDDYIQLDGFWIPFLSSIEGVEYFSEQDRHLRLFQSRLGWPGTMHSRPPASNQHYLARDTGVIHHNRSLDEMVSDYLRYLERSVGDRGWETHNRLMLHDACAATARSKGWDFVTAFPWWPRAKQAAFAGCAESCTMPYTGYDCHQ
jgi:hypothetical protein